MVVFLAASTVLACGAPDDTATTVDPYDSATAEHVGGASCTRCHRVQARYWSASRHRRAGMEPLAGDEVTCEGCHGPGSAHLAWAEAVARREPVPALERLGLAVRLEDPGRGTWIVSPETGKGLRLAPRVSTAEVETCVRCHTEGSFRDSGKYREGVTCSDCHEPHGLDLLFPGDKVCARCHAVDRFEAEAHHFHEPGQEGSGCVDCHMPVRDRTAADPRRDHGLRPPRPDLSLTTGASNACNDCHDDKSVEWAVAAVERWYRSGRPSDGGRAPS